MMDASGSEIVVCATIIAGVATGGASAAGATLVVEVGGDGD